MSEKTAIRTREKWVDDVKVIACILVVLGHFFQSMTKANILPESNLYKWFNTTIYYFHVPLFFICSGYLYQKHSKVNSVSSWGRNVTKKALTLGVPYATFTTATWVLKKAFSSNVNDQIGGFGDTLFLHPTAPYWYLYTLFLIFFFTPTFRKREIAVLAMLIANVARFLCLTSMNIDTFAVSTVLTSESWFVLGMCIFVFNIQLRTKKAVGWIGGGIFVFLSIIGYKGNISNIWFSYLMGLLACISIILLVKGYENTFGKGMHFLSKYTMPIFLMHTLFAAPMRSVLLKVGIKNVMVHVILGLGISFAGPIIVAWIMKKTKWLEFFLYPNRVLQGK